MLIMTSKQNGDSDYSNLDQNRDTFVDNNNEVDFQPSVDNVEMSNRDSYTGAPVPRNITFEFYLPLPTGRILYVTYTELDALEIASLLNNRVDLTHIPDDQLSHHHNIHSFIRQQFQQQSVDYQ